MSEETKAEAKKIRFTVTFPTKETFIKALTSMFPGIEVTVEEEKPAGSEEEAEDE